MSKITFRSALIEKMYYGREANRNFNVGTANNATSVDAVEVVRCKDCLWGKEYKRVDAKTGYYCQHPAQTFTYGINWERIFEPVKAGTDFCSYGERKEDGDNEPK